jgi:hypothetical protein
MKRLDPSAIRVIDDNHNCVAGTFIYDLGERCTFSRARLKTLVEAIHRIARQRARGLDLDSATATKLFNLYEMVVRCSLLAHFDPQDGARIEKLPAGRRRDWHDDIDEFHDAIWSYMSGVLIPRSPARSPSKPPTKY